MARSGAGPFLDFGRGGGREGQGARISLFVSGRPGAFKLSADPLLIEKVVDVAGLSPRDQGLAGPPPPLPHALHPTGSSWINQAEGWVGYLTDQKIRRGAHKACRPWRKTSATGSRTGTPIPGHSYGPRSPRRSWSPSPDTADAFQARHTGGQRGDRPQADVLPRTCPTSVAECSRGSARSRPARWADVEVDGGEQQA
jgi:hypothetical protein